MDTMRGNFGPPAESDGYDPGDEETGRETPPASIGQDERRMQVRAYNHWASLLGDRNFPAIEDLEPEQLPDFGPYSVLLDFTNGIEDPGISYLGARLAEECDVSGDELQTLSEVPARSLLTRITDHYMQILANQAPIGFEAEFVNQRGATLAYRGIMLPFSSDDDTIDFIYGVINWKELADAHAADELLLEIDQALDAAPAPAALDDGPEASADWPAAAVPANDVAPHMEEYMPNSEEGRTGAEADDVLPMPSFGYGEEEPEDESALELAAFELDDEDYLDPEEADENAESDDEDSLAGASFGSLLKMPLSMAKQIEKTAVALPEIDEEDLALNAAMTMADLETAEPDGSALDPAEMGLGDWLAAAREKAAAARTSEDRTRGALYDAIGRAYDFSLAAAESPQEFDELLSDAELTVQDRAPMTPIVKLVFGADYDKTRLTEYAAALSHAHRLQLPFGSMGRFLSEHEGGLKGVVKAERRLRKEEAGKLVEPAEGPRQALARKLREMAAQDFAAIDPSGSEFALVMIRRTGAGEVIMLGEVPEDVPLLERAARRLIG